MRHPSRIFLIAVLTIALLGSTIQAQDIPPTESSTVIPTETALPTASPVFLPTESPIPTDAPLSPPTETPIVTEEIIPTTEPPALEPTLELSPTAETTAVLEWTPTLLPTLTFTPTADVAAQEYRGRLYWAQTVYNQCMSSANHQWYYWLPSDNSYNPYLIDIQPVSGSLRYDMSLTGPGVNMSAPSSIDGRGILWLSSGGGDYNLYLYPRAGSNGCYNIAIWATSIPKLAFIWGFQSSYSNIARWQFNFETTYSYYVEVQRTEGNLEYSYQLVNRSTGQTISGTAGNSYRGNAVVAATSGSGWYDFYMNPGSTQGSYRIAIVQGVRPIDPPAIVQPSANQVINRPTLNVVLERSLGNGRGMDFHLQVSRNSAFTDLVYDQTSTSTSFSLNLANGNYWARAWQGDTINVSSSWSAVVPFTVSVVQPPVLVSPPDGAAVATNPPTLSWNASVNAARYEVRFGKTNPPTATLYSGPSRSWQPTAPLVANTYYWQVRAFDSTNYASSWSPVRSFSLQSPTNAAPLLNYFPAAVTLNWTTITWATGYEVQVDDNNLFATPDYQNAAIPAGTTELTITSLPPGTYFWRVRPQKADGTNGAWSTNGVGTFTIDIP